MTTNAERWKSAKITRPDFDSVASRLCAAKPRYKAVSARTGVPWFVIAVIHERESSQNWNASLAQGDPWNKVSVHVPSGRGPFSSWEDAAIDALVNCEPRAARWKDWSVGGTLDLLERYNGLGYRNRGLPSPYIWSGTDKYTSGKYVADGVFDPNVVDKQLGCAGLIMAMQKIDPSISFGGIQAKHIGAGTVVVGGSIAAQKAHQSGASIGTIVFITIATLALAVIVWLVLHKKTQVMWQKIKTWFHDSEIIFFARLKVFIGSIVLAVQASGVDLSTLTTNPKLQMAIKVFFAWLVADGATTEWLRRRRADDLGPGKP